ncbi:hypothetical protein [Aureimonas sp. SA4125]|uniref:hypothetical protein n=1 Tax=Aureimonas sp. SA4125 TaxID=2826993 RepID=UPI001CC548CF|nr:hypothetical protein [Aureimonas sp. SA4125]
MTTIENCKNATLAERGGTSTMRALALWAGRLAQSYGVFRLQDGLRTRPPGMSAIELLDGRDVLGGSKLGEKAR